MKKILILILVLAAVLSISGVALADNPGELDIANGSIVITETGYSLNGAAEVPYTGDYVITQTDAATATANTITVNGIADGKTITLNGVNMSGSTSMINVNADATLLLENTNSVISIAVKTPTICIASGKTLVIDGTGSLTVKGGTQSAGIGGEGNLVIDGGNISAVGKSGAAAIGGCYGGRYNIFGSITINDGTVTISKDEGAEFSGICPVANTAGGGNVTINGGKINISLKFAQDYAAIGGGKGSNAFTGDVIINGGEITVDVTANANQYAIRTAGAFKMTGGTLVEIKKHSSSTRDYITAGSVSITGGNVKEYYKEPTDSNGRKLAKLYVVDSSGAAQKNKEVEVSVNSDTPWKAVTDDNGFITTYMADTDKVNGTDKLNGGWLIGGTCVCDTAPLTFADTADEVDVYSASVDVDVTVRGECAMPIHKDVTVTCVIDSVTLEDGTTVTASEYVAYAAYDAATKKLTLKPAEDNYTVKLRAQRNVVDTPAYHEIKVCASNTVGRKLNIANGPITVAAAGEEGKVTYTQGSNTFTVSEDTPVTITGTSSENNIEISTDATIVLRDLSLTDITAKSPIKITKNATLNLWLEGENTLTTGTYNHNEGIGSVNGVTTAAIFVESGSTLIIDSEAGTLTNDDIDAAHYGDKQQGYAGSLLAKNTGTRGGASAIGGDYFADPNMACGNITIKGGNVTAQATLASSKFFSGAAIGSGYTGTDGSVVPDAMCGDITITGGNIRALAAEGSTTPGRAISSGVGDLTITGGVIYASAPNDGWNGDSAGSIYSHNGTLTIGEANGDDSDLYIYAGTTTKDVTGTDNAAPAIGVSSGGTLNILSGTITAESTGNGPAIGVAAYAPVKDEPVELNIKGGTIKLTLADETQAGTPAAIGIGGNNYDNKIEINISGGSIESDKLNIGVRGNQDSKVNISGDAKVTVNNGNLVGDLNTSGTSYTTIGGNVSGDVTVGAGSAVNVKNEVKGEATVEKGGILDYEGEVGKLDAAPGSIVNGKTVLPEIIEGANGTFNGQAEGLPFTSNAEYDDFLSVEVDGNVVDGANYTVSEGSTVVTLKAAYLKTLTVGEHTLEIVSKYRYCGN